MALLMHFSERNNAKEKSSVMKNFERLAASIQNDLKHQICREKAELPTKYPMKIYSMLIVVHFSSRY